MPITNEEQFKALRHSFAKVLSRLAGCVDNGCTKEELMQIMKDRATPKGLTMLPVFEQAIDYLIEVQGTDHPVRSHNLYPYTDAEWREHFVKESSCR